MIKRSGLGQQVMKRCHSFARGLHIWWQVIHYIIVVCMFSDWRQESSQVSRQAVA